MRFLSRSRNKKYYRVLESRDLDNLIREVEMHLNKGWSLAGGIYVDRIKISGDLYNYRATTTYYQSVEKQTRGN